MALLVGRRERWTLEIGVAPCALRAGDCVVVGELAHGSGVRAHRVSERDGGKRPTRPTPDPRRPVEWAGKAGPRESCDTGSRRRAEVRMRQQRSRRGACSEPSTRAEEARHT